MGYFLPFYYSPKCWKYQNLEKMNKMPGDIIILHMHTKNYDQMMYGSWDMVRDRCNSFSFWAIFCPFIPLAAQKIKIKKRKMKKKPWRYYFTYVYQKLWSDDVQFLRYGAWQMQLFFILGHFLPFYPPNSLKNQSFEEMKKTPGDKIILHMCIKYYDQMMCSSWDMLHDRQTDGKSDI